MLAALALSGCATTPKIEHYKSAARDTVLSAADGHGALVIGIDLGSMWSMNNRDVRRLELWTVDTEKRLLIDPNRGGRVVGLTRGSWIAGRDKAGNSELILQKVPAGTYYLAFANWGAGEASPIAPQSIAFTIKPGAAAYVGSYSFDTPWTIFGQIELKPVKRDTAAARALLAKYPNMSVEFVDEQARMMSLACKVEMGSSPHRSCLTAL